MKKKIKLSTTTVKRLKTLLIETVKNKKAMLEQLQKNPVIQVCCQRVGIGRSTYYEWMANDKKFSEEATSAKMEGKKFMNDIAESQLIKAIGEGRMTAIIYWLKNNHSDYTDRIRYEHQHTHHIEMDEEEQKKVALALHNIGLGNVLKYNGDKRTIDEYYADQEKEKVAYKEQLKNLPKQE